MKTQRWLLPFTQAIDMQALEAAFRIAVQSEATLVALSLMIPPRGRYVRLEQIQQSKDFLEAVKWKACRHQVSVERHEIVAEDFLESLAAHVLALDCQSVILLSYGKKDTLLAMQEVKQLFLAPPAPLLFLALPATGVESPLNGHFLSWLDRLFARQDKRTRFWASAERGVETWVDIHPTEKQQRV